jgi:hypothetical protein
VEGYGCPSDEVWLPQSPFGVEETTCQVVCTSPLFKELVRLKALSSLTLELFNLQRQSKELATHSPGVVTQKT